MEPLWLLLWLLIPLLLALYAFALILSIHGSVRICRTRLGELQDRFKELDRKLEELRTEIRTR